ncbi:MAG TPA: glycosyltransferase [Caulobacteraceae bacterium]|nr:glycosyltransferase [Caulobacteraceae bacterium]
MSYRLVEVELTRAPEPIALGPEDHGLGLIARWKDRLVGFEMLKLDPGAVLDAEAVTELAERKFGARVVAAEIEAELAEARPAFAASPPSLTVAVCTKDRPERLERLLRSLEPVVRDGGGFAAVEVLVVDNAPSDERTREAVERLGWPRYRREPKPGLDFARNAALNGATGDLLAFLDDDVVVDRGWLSGLHGAWAAWPEAGGWTGLVLPYELRTEAQVMFELRGGFGRGFERIVHGVEKRDNRLYPVGAGIFGAGCNMAFDRRLLLELGGFDEALDTGAPLPGGGDLDIFYRVVRSGRPLVYEPRYAVYHQHRETLEQLRRQYWTWGLGFMAFLVKQMRHDPSLRPRQLGMLRWWFASMIEAVLWGTKRRLFTEVGFSLAELWGGVVGLVGEYDRSRARVRRIREVA